jgi:hypothetical protein
MDPFEPSKPNSNLVLRYIRTIMVPVHTQSMKAATLDSGRRRAHLVRSGHLADEVESSYLLEPYLAGM